VNRFKGKALGAVVGLVFGMAATAAETYTTVPWIGRGFSWKGWDLNDNGEVVGEGQSDAYFANLTDRAEVVPELINRGYPILRAINKHQVMVGVSPSGTNEMVALHAFSFDRKTGRLRDLGSLLGADGQSAALGINDSGIIVGDSYTADGIRAVRFELDGRITDLATLGGNWSSATDINEQGAIVGASKNAEGLWRAFLFNSENVMVDLGTLGGKEARGRRINNKGQIVGTAMTTDGAWEAFLWSEGKMIGLGQLGGTYSDAQGINDDGVVVGRAMDASGSWKGWVRYPNGPMIDVTSVAAIPDTLDNVTAINSNGMILATLYRRLGRIEEYYPVVLSPGVFSGTLNGGQWQVSINAPPGSVVQLDGTQDFKAWTQRLSTTIEASGVTHSEPVENGPKFYRVTIRR
jgi:probable HAF family extracellular repeat protein